MGEERKVYKVLVEGPKEGDHAEDQGVGGRMCSEYFLGDWLGIVDWIRLAQDRDRWWAVVSAVMILRVLATRSYHII
jgi:hypothetical protein